MIAYQKIPIQICDYCIVVSVQIKNIQLECQYRIAYAELEC